MEAPDMPTNMSIKIPCHEEKVTVICQRGRELEITQDDLEIIKIDHSYSVMEQGSQMLLKWFQSCDPAKRTPQTLKEALLETECFTALECLLSDFS
ncbi:E3 ubiquitin-protein ligase MIB1-like [Octopus vulgaris]|uniref:E3 ubiquitin-protein ligase MIB1-like n=1 Tax=Octopus vulgaris TaxID=6645 RepID=A0AA36C005_OCTVU|nr:E3 ubiquitin-protein ligase MIB1-like [Octopus vulgaris]